MERIKDALGGFNTRSSTIFDRLKNNGDKTDKWYKTNYSQWSVFPEGAHLYSGPMIVKTSTDTIIINQESNKTTLQNLEIRDSIIKHKLYEKIINNKNK